MTEKWPNQFIEIDDSDETRFFLTAHLLEGLAFPNQSRWKQQWIHNEIRIDELKNLSAPFKEADITPILLKGIDLINRVYSDHGVRFLSDVDLLITPEDLPPLTKIMLANGYSILKEKKWFGNLNKITFIKFSCNTEIIIECHTHMFYHLKEDFRELEASYIDGYQQLSLEYLLVQLCGHLSFQHNFLKAYWLFDIYYLLKAKSEVINWEHVKKLSIKLQLHTSIVQVLWVLKTHFNVILTFQTKELFKLNKFYFWQPIITKEFIKSDRQSGWRYFLLKHLTKDSIWLALKYDLLWALSYFNKKHK